MILPQLFFSIIILAGPNYGKKVGKKVNYLNYVHNLAHTSRYASNGICEGFCILCCMSIELWKKIWKKYASDNLTTLFFHPIKSVEKNPFFFSIILSVTVLTMTIEVRFQS